MGDELDHGLHADGRGVVSALEHVGVTPDYRHVEKVVARGAEPRARRRGPQVVRHRARRRSRAARAAGARAPQPARRGAQRRARHTGRARLRHPPSLRRELLLPARVHLAQRERALGDASGRRTARATSSSARGPSRARTARPSACGSSGAVCHERQAWTRYLCSPRDDEARRAYLRSTYEGVA